MGRVMVFRRSIARGMLAAALLLCLIAPLAAQSSLQDVIEISAEVGFDSFFRVGQWTPVRVQLRNNGDSLSGRLVIRPETSGTVVGNAFSTALELPSGAQKSATFNIQARSFPDQLRVELIDEDGGVRATTEARLIDLRLHDQLVAVVSGSNIAAPNMSGFQVGGSRAELALLTAPELPEDSQSLAALDVLLLIDVDSENLSSRQRQAIRRWVAAGGHLILAGGPSAQRSVRGFADITPFQPQSSQSLSQMSAYARFGGDSASSLNERGIVATGNVLPDGRVLLAQDGIPLLIRRDYGAGVVDFLAADPTLQPLAGWGGIELLWRKLMTTRAPHPVWVHGFTHPEWGAEAVANLPGVDLLPPAEALCLFLIFYIGLIGPVNYLVLSRINRSGWGWFTVPLVIASFALIAWTVGFNLRGGEIIVSRLSVVLAPADTEEAQLNQYVGMLSPRRAAYSLEAGADRFLAVAGATTPSSIFASNTIQTSTEISQGAVFAARDFTIDGGIFANFAISGYLEAPAIAGSFTLTYELAESGRMLSGYQGLIRNESELTLRDAVLLGPGLYHRLEEDFGPGDALALDRQQLRGSLSDMPPQPNPLELQVLALTGTASPFSGSARNISIRQIQGQRYLRSRAFLNAQSVGERQAAREQAFLASFLVDQYQSTGRGTGLYLAGWTDSWERDLSISGAGWGSIDTSLYLIELDVDIALPSGRATLTSENFTWTALSRDGISHQGTDDFSLYEGQSVEFLLTPLPGLAMDTVDRLFLEIDRGGGYAQALDAELYNWERDAYDIFNYRLSENLEFEQPGRYLGAGNAVQIRLDFGEGVGTAWVREIRIEQTGSYD